MTVPDYFNAKAAYQAHLELSEELLEATEVVEAEVNRVIESGDRYACMAYLVKLQLGIEGIPHAGKYPPLQRMISNLLEATQ